MLEMAGHLEAASGSAARVAPGPSDVGLSHARGLAWGDGMTVSDTRSCFSLNFSFRYVTQTCIFGI